MTSSPSPFVWSVAGSLTRPLPCGMFLFLTGLHVWQSRRDPHQAASIQGFQIHSETGMSAENRAPGCAELPTWAPWGQAVGASPGYSEQLLHYSSLTRILQMQLNHCPGTGSKALLSVCLSAVGRHRMTGRQSFQSRFTSSLCLSSCRQSRQKQSSISVIPFLSFFPSFPWETQHTCVSSHRGILSLPFLSTNQNSSPQPISSMPSFYFVFLLGLDW